MVYAALGEPQKVGVAWIDLFTGLYGVIGIQAALSERQRSGCGQHVDLSLLDVGIATLADQGMNFLAGGTVPHRMGNAHPNIVPYQVFPAADGILILSAAVLGMLPTASLAEDSTATGMVGGAATGAIVGGPVGAGVGAVVGAVAGAALEPPPEKVITYVQQQPASQSVVVQQPIVVGKPLPREVVLTRVAEDPRYAYTIVNDQRVIVDPKTYTVVQVIQ